MPTICSHPKTHSTQPTHRDIREAHSITQATVPTQMPHMHTRSAPAHPQHCHRAWCWHSRTRKQPGLRCVCVGGGANGDAQLHQYAAHNPLQDPTAAPHRRYSLTRHVPRHAAVETRGVVYSHTNTNTHNTALLALWQNPYGALTTTPQCEDCTTHTHPRPQSAMQHETPAGACTTHTLAPSAPCNTRHPAEVLHSHGKVVQATHKPLKLR